MISVEQARKYCYQDISLIENYERAVADKTQTWDCHHRVETIMNCSAEELIAQGCYKDRPAHDLIFLTKAEHSRLHNVGKKLSADTRAKMSKAKSGENHPMFGKHHSEKTLEKIRAAMNRPETRAKMSASMSGENHPMYGKTRSAETRAKISAAKSASNYGNHWFNNGIENKFCKECPGEGWQRGRL